MIWVYYMYNFFLIGNQKTNINDKKNKRKVHDVHDDEQQEKKKSKQHNKKMVIRKLG